VKDAGLERRSTFRHRVFHADANRDHLLTGQNADEPGSAHDGGPPALRLTGLHKEFGDNVAVRHIDLTVPRGSFFGLVGPNGAGKTTALSMAVGLLRPELRSSQDVLLALQEPPLLLPWTV
jgi:ATPase subunit of ABC transporter with duplicated ATPase domains